MIVLALNLAAALRASLSMLSAGNAEAPESSALTALDTLAPDAAPADHSPAPWQEGGGNHVGPNGRTDNYVRDARGALVAYAASCYLTGERHGVKLTTTRRVVACVNACEGISTELLEALATDAAAALQIGQQLADALRSLARRGCIHAPGLEVLALFDAMTANPAAAAGGGHHAWTAGGTRTGEEAPRGVFDRFVRGANGETVVLVEGEGQQARRDARRVAACVNACAGLSNDQLRALPTPCHALGPYSDPRPWPFRRPQEAAVATWHEG